MRLIDADAIRLPKGFFEDVDNVPKFYKWLSEQPTIDPVKWIPCERRLPEKEYEVLVTTSWHAVCIAWYDNGKWRAEYINEYDDDEILAWMPLPMPWKGEKR